MLHRNMDQTLHPDLLLDLDDVLGNLQHARRAGDLGRLALLTYWEAGKWARRARRDALAARAQDVMIQQPHPDKAAFLSIVDDVIHELERIRHDLH